MAKLACADATPPAAPAMEVTKKVANFLGDPSAAVVGNEVIYLIEVCNTGNVVISNVTITDPGADSIAGANVGTLSPGACASATARRKVEQADLDAGSIINTATADGTDPSGAAIGASGTVTQPLDPERPAITIDKRLKAGTAVPLTVGQVVVYEFEVKNTGDVPLSNVTVVDPLVVGGITGSPIATLAVGAAQVLTAAVTVTEAMPTGANGARVLTNTATASGKSPSGATVTASDTNTAAVKDVIRCYTACPPCAGTGAASQPQADQNVKGNPNYIDVMDIYWMFVDCDGTMSAYNIYSRALANNTYSWTTFSGGPLNGVTLAKAVADMKAGVLPRKLMSMEDGFFNVVDTDGSLGFYGTDGIYNAGLSASYTAASFSGGSLNGVSLQNAVNGAVAGVKYVGQSAAHFVFYNSNTGKVESYYEAAQPAFYDNVWSLGGATNLTGGPFQGTLAAAMASGNFVGVSEDRLRFIDPATNNLVEYYMANGALLSNLAGSGQPMLPACPDWKCTNGTCVRTDAVAPNQTEAALLASSPTPTLVPCP